MKRPAIFLIILLCVHSLSAVEPGGAPKPNLIFILSDDLGQGDLGCYGNTNIQTPNLDRMAREGTRFTQAYCGTPICAPSRTVLMTGLHTGHTPVRGNREIQPEGQHPLPAETVTVAEILKGAGYATAAVGKWGMGMFDTTGSPLKQGFDHFFGYNCHPQSRPTPFLWEYGRQRDYLYTRRIRHAQSESRHPRWSMKAPPQR